MQKEILRLHKSYELKIKTLLNTTFKAKRETLPACFYLDLFYYIGRVAEKHGALVFWMGHADERYSRTLGYQQGDNIVIAKSYDLQGLIATLVHEIGHYQRGYKKIKRVTEKNIFSKAHYRALSNLRPISSFHGELEAWRFGEHLLKTILKNIGGNFYEKF